VSGKELLRSTILQNFPHQPTSGQFDLVQKLSDFILNQDDLSTFILKGYAGTGKTTIISSLVKSLPIIKFKTVLLAPTGRAAKVLSGFSAQQAFTIHKKIYRQSANSEGNLFFSLQPNLHVNTIFIVDEASMISEGTNDTYIRSSLLEDLCEYVYSGVNCKMILIGDVAQLPPVGLKISPALDVEHFKSKYISNVHSVELQEVVRQKEESGILFNATKIRQLLKENEVRTPKFNLSFDDVTRIQGGELEDAINQCYSRYGQEETMVICRSNKRANQYNQQIRARILWQEDELAGGDYLMVVKNNYHWLPQENKAGFIANGDIIQMSKARGIREMHGFRFADATIRLIDYPDEIDLEVKLLLDTLTSEAPALSYEQNKALYQSVLIDYIEEPNKSKRNAMIKKDPFMNALQVKFAYAVTCHKAQGGQWPAVFVDQGYFTNEMLDKEYLRWLYTAITRASKHLFLVNFSDDFFED